MSKKKSYMNNENILAESFFSKLARLLRIPSKEEKILRKDKKIVSGFMSLRLLLLRSTWSPEEEDRAQMMLDSYTSYSQGGRSKADISIMLARDYMFLAQNSTNSAIQQHQQPPTQANFFNHGQGSLATLSGNSFEIDVHNLPMLGPVSAQDNLSIISN